MEITVVLQDSTVLEFSGADAMLDTTENALIISGDQGEYVALYWPFVAFYIVTPPESDEEEAEANA